MFNLRRISIGILLLTVFSVVGYGQKLANKVDYAKKIQEATPKSLPQKPIAKKLKSDAQDENLKGKVKSVIEYTLESGMKSREVESENYYDESGNLTKSVSFNEGYPQSVTVWGYIDENRVNNTADVEYSDAERPQYRRMLITGRLPASASTSKKDDRYSIKYTYKYNENGQLIEKWTYGNAGENFFHQEFRYNGNEREVYDFDGQGSQMSRTVEILNKDGNIIERYSKDEDGKIGDKEFRTQELDKEGNWIVEKTFEQSKVKGKIVKKLLWTSYRTITYYP